MLTLAYAEAVLIPGLLSGLHTCCSAKLLVEAAQQMCSNKYFLVAARLGMQSCPPLFPPLPPWPTSDCGPAASITCECTYSGGRPAGAISSREAFDGLKRLPGGLPDRPAPAPTALRIPCPHCQLEDHGASIPLPDGAIFCHNDFATDCPDLEVRSSARGTTEWHRGRLDVPHRLPQSSNITSTTIRIALLPVVARGTLQSAAGTSSAAAVACESCKPTAQLKSS
jgi:hypothetical protein